VIGDVARRGKATDALQRLKARADAMMEHIP
jgi:hypothetical protein